MKVNTLTLKDSLYPDRLRELNGMPAKIYAIGNISLLNSDRILSVVGSRKYSPYGQTITRDLVYQVSSRNVVIISGLAIGVDGLAHQACLDAGGKTIAVMAGGLDSIHPTSHRNLALNILKSGGLLISEYSEGSPPLKQNFIARNRIVSGLCDALLVTEAGLKSGTLHTANFALEQGKSVLAVPGNINSPNSVGTNNLIKTGASPVTDYSDILQALDIDDSEMNEQVFGDNSEETTILELLARGITDASELLTESNLDASKFNQTLTMLEISGKARPLGNNQWTT